MEIKNGIITSATITNDSHGMLSAYIQLDYGGAGQSFGGHVLHQPFKAKTRHVKDQGNYCGEFIWKVMEVAEVSEWSQLVGKTVRAKADHGGIEAIGHIVKDIWFSPSEEWYDADNV